MEVKKISTGSQDLNKWLGGYESDIITTFYGPGGSGKTNFCMMAAASRARRGERVIYVDTEGGFSVERYNQLSSEGIENIMLLKPTSFDEQESAFGKLLKELKRADIRLIVVDGMTMLYRLELAEVKNDKKLVDRVNSKLARQMRILAEIARKRGIPVLMTNQVYSEFLSEEELKAGKIAGVRMVGGDILKYWSKCIIELINQGGRRKAVLRKHRSMADSELQIEITNSGVRRRGLF